MSTWNRVMREVESLNTPDSLDVVRRKKIERVQQLTGRALVIYATDFTSTNTAKTNLPGAMLISLTDKDGFDEVTQNVKQEEVDVLLHSPGGSAVLAIGKHITAIGGALAEIGKLAQNYENTGAWKSRMVVQMALVRFSHQQILALEVPPKIGAVRAATLNATTDCDAAMDKLASGIDNNSANDFNAAGKLMQSCGEKIKDVMPELQALQQ